PVPTFRSLVSSEEGAGVFGTSTVGLSAAFALLVDGVVDAAAAVVVVVVPLVETLVFFLPPPWFESRKRPPTISTASTANVMTWRLRCRRRAAARAASRRARCPSF